MRFTRVQPGYYFTAQAVTVGGKETRATAEKQDSGLWLLRLVGFPASFDTLHRSMTLARKALADMIDGRTDLDLWEVR